MGAVPGCSWGRGALHHNVPMQVLDADATRRLLPSAPLIAALRAKFIAGCEAPLRHTHAIGAGQDASAEVAGVPIGRGTEAAQAGTLLLMPAWQPGRFLGIQTVSIFLAMRRWVCRGLHSVYLLLDARTGVPLLQLDGNEITSRPTAAASALAASYLAREDAAPPSCARWWCRRSPR